MAFWTKNCCLSTVRTLMMLAVFVLFTSQTMAANRIGLVKTYDPSATVIRQGQEFQLFEGAEIYEGDTIVTDDYGSVGIAFEDGAVLTLGASGKIIIENFLFKLDRKEGSFISKIVTGSVAFVSGRINKISPGSVQFITPTATLGLRGTKILIEVK